MMITFTKEEFFQETGDNLDTLLNADKDSKHAQRYIDFICREIDNHIRKYNPRIFRRGYEELSKFQIDTIKEACIQHGLNTYNTGHTFIDENGIPKRIPIGENVKDILRPIMYRGI